MLLIMASFQVSRNSSYILYFPGAAVTRKEGDNTQSFIDYGGGGGEINQETGRKSEFWC